MAYSDQIVIQQATDGRGTAGAPVPTWATYKTVWAERQDQNGYKANESEMPVFTDGISFKIHLYDAPNLTSKMQVSYDSDEWDIIRIEKLGRFHFIIYVEAHDDE